MKRSDSAWTLALVSLGVFIAQLDSSVVNLALKSVQSDVQASVGALQWVLDAYNLTYASFILVGGTVGDVVGRKRTFVGGIGVLTLGAAVCALAPSVGWLVAGRALAGLGAALTVPTSLAILAATFEAERERANALGVWAAMNGLAFAVGPPLGGALVEAFRWRSVFWLAVPLGVLAFGAAVAQLHESRAATRRGFDIPGQALAVVALGAFAYAGISAGASHALAVPLLVAALGCAALVAFIVRERSTSQPLVDLATFAHAPFSAAIGVAATMTFGMYAALFVIPIFVQGVWHASPALAGSALLPLSLAFLATSIGAGAIVTRLGARLTLGAGMAAMGCGLVAVGALGEDPNYLALSVALVSAGVGLGLVTGPVMGVAIAAVKSERAGMASGIANAARMVGATLGIALLGSAFATGAGQNLTDVSRIAGGMHLALWLGGSVQLAGAIVALTFVRRRSLAPA